MYNWESFSVHLSRSFYSLNAQFHCYKADCFLHCYWGSRCGTVDFVAAEVEGIEVVVVEEADDLSMMGGQ